MLLLSKVVPLLVTAVFALALGPSRYSPPPPPVRYARLGFFGHRLWRLFHPPESTPSNALLVLPPPQLPRLLLPPKPIDSGVCINNENKHKKSHKTLPIKLPSSSIREEKREFRSVNKCACPLVEGYYEQEAGVYPRYIFGVECLFSDIRVPDTMRSANICTNANPYFQTTVFCEQRTIKMYFLTERNESLSRDEAKDEEEFPEDLRDKWMYITRDINSSCEYTGSIN